MRRLGLVVPGALLLSLLCAPAQAISPAAHSAEHDAAYRIGLQAYAYGLPLLTTNETFLAMTGPPVAQGVYGPVNAFHSNTGANTAASTAVVAPGATSLSSIAWLDLTTGPQVLHVPKVTGHSFVLAFLDPYTTNLVNLGTASKTPPGDYVVRDPSQRSVAVPAGTHALDVDYSRIWIIGSTQLKGPRDVPAVNAIQVGYTLTSLQEYVSGTAPAPPLATAPPTAADAAPAALQFFDTLGRLLQQFPPPPRDAPALRTFATVGIGPGMTPSQNSQLSAETVQGLADAIAAGPAEITKATDALVRAGFTRHNGYLLGGFGRYGTDYVKRAVISQIGLGAFVAEQAIYAMAWTDTSGRALDGSRRYVLHLATPPPTREGWSLTVYDLNGALIDNPINRYALTSSSTLTRNPDGSVDIFVQPRRPTQASRRSNWLPVADGQGFEITWRLFAPDASAIPGILQGAGWQPPKVARPRS